LSLDAKPIPRVLSRHNLLIGGEREPVLLSALVFGGVAASSMTIVAFVICGLLWCMSLAVWRWMAKADPQLSRIYRRSLKYRGFYPAYSRPYRRK
jgi:type IV secretory pathway TrbD component